MRPFKSIDEQINILKKRGLLFTDEEAAKKHLLQYNYYEIVNGYKDCLLETPATPENEEAYATGATFEHLFALYKFDASLREAVLNSVLEFELVLKTAVAYIIAKHFGVDEKKYLKRTNFDSGAYVKTINDKPIYEIDDLLYRFKKIVRDNAQPFKHYRETHAHIPPWILVKGASLGNMKTFYKLQKSGTKTEILAIILGIPAEVIETFQLNALKDLFSDILEILTRFRNRAAHSGRIFNYRTENVRIRHNAMFHKQMSIDNAEYRKGYGQRDLYTLYHSLSVFDAFMPHLKLLVSMKQALNKHLELYPEDSEFLLTGLGVPEKHMTKSIDEIFSIDQVYS